MSDNNNLIKINNVSLLTNARVSILINNYNYGFFLEECIRSALNQDYQNIEVIIVDDGSTDNSINILQTYSQRVQSVFQKNSGQASAFNAGFAESQGDIICFLDSDDFFYSDKVSKVVKTFSEDPTIGWIFHELDYVDSSGEKLSKMREKSLKYPKRIDFRADLQLGVPPKESIPCGLCFRREVIEKILPMPESNGVSISDSYIKYAAIGLSKGLLQNEKLAVQRIHDCNTYTFRSDNHNLHAEIHVKTGFYLQERFPNTGKFANKLFIKGVAEMMANFTLFSLLTTKEIKLYLARNMTPSFILLNIPRCLYHFCYYLVLRLRRSQWTNRQDAS